MVEGSFSDVTEVVYGPFGKDIVTNSGQGFYAQIFFMFTEKLFQQGYIDVLKDIDRPETNTPVREPESAQQCFDGQWTGKVEGRPHLPSGAVVDGREHAQGQARFTLHSVYDFLVLEMVKCRLAVFHDQGIGHAGIPPLFSNFRDTLRGLGWIVTDTVGLGAWGENMCVRGLGYAPSDFQ